MDASPIVMPSSGQRAALLISLLLFAALVLVWQLATMRPAFDAKGYTVEQLRKMAFNGDIIRGRDGRYIYNPDKARGFPGPWAVLTTAVDEFAHAFHKKGTNDHGIGHLIRYTVTRFAMGFLAASVVAVCLGVLIGLSKTLYQALNPFIQVLKPISPLAWMPLLLYTVQSPTWTAMLVVFLASLWPTIANTAFGVSTIRKDYLQVASLLQLSWVQRLMRVVLPAAAPAIVAGLRISFGSALVAVVPAEMLLGELGVGYLTWIEWNNLHIAGILFAILVIGIVGVTLDAAFNRLARLVTYTE
jgi:nitrate/nitrite transport system permease protein